MKPQTLHSLITARALLDQSELLIYSDDRYRATAGLIILQDALELILLAVLNELGIDETKNLESKSFDELLGELKKAGIRIPKIGTLKALNKQRVISKHYGQIAEPITVKHYCEAALNGIDVIVPEVLGKSIREIFLSDLLQDGEAKEFLSTASRLITENHLLGALIEIRKAIFVEIEVDYSVYDYRDGTENRPLGLLALGLGGLKAPYWTKDKEWISKNVRTPIDYVQIDHEKLRLDAMEWGVHTSELANVRRLTPRVFRPDKKAAWHIEVPPGFAADQANKTNAEYCLDRTISVVLKKQQHSSLHRWPNRDAAFSPPDSYIGAPVFSKAIRDAEIVHLISDAFEYSIDAIVSGFDAKETYYHISGFGKDAAIPLPDRLVTGYLLIPSEEGKDP